MINGHLPVIYLQEDGCRGAVWLEGGERRRAESVGERDGGRKSKEFPALDLTWELGFLRGEVHIQVCVCVCLTVYLQSFSSCSAHR